MPGDSIPISDRECLEAWRRNPGAEALRPLLERYGSLVHSSAYRRMGNAAQAAEVSRAVFLVLARRARKLRKKTVLAGWLFRVTAITCRKLKPRRRWWHRFHRRRSEPPSEVTGLLGPEADAALDRLRVAQQDAVLLRLWLNREWESVARTLGTSERRAGKRVERGFKKLARRLRRRIGSVETLTRACSTEGCATPLPDSLGILESIEATKGRKPAVKLARRTLSSLAWARWRRRVAIGVPTFFVLLAILGGIVWHIGASSGHSRLISTFIIWSVRWNLKKIAEPARPWPTDPATPRLDARNVRNASDLYQTTNIWLGQLNFTREQWKALEPKRIGPMPNFMLPDGLIHLRNPATRRSGLLGVLGYELGWTQAGFEFGGVAFTNVAVRVKGNLASLVEPKHPFKVDLNRFAKGQKLSGLDELTFNNLAWDFSFLGEALGYEFFRDAGVPAPRTAYAWLSASVSGRWERKPLGLYLLLEPVGEAFVGERFGSRKTPVFKPVTYTLFKHLGEDWSAYAGIYDVKTKTTPEQQRRVIEFARLVSSATDGEFAARVGDFLDLDEFARFLAGHILLSSYDSILTDGQNFYMYLDPRSNKFGFVPWDLDAAWGNFWLGSRQEMERASIWHPWVGKNRFLERVMKVEEFRRIYRAHLEDFLARLFVPQRLHRRIDELAAILHAPIAAESAFRLNKFEQAVGMKAVQVSPGEDPPGMNPPAYELKRFIEGRARSVRRQLDGKSTGIIVKPPAERR